MTQYCIWQVSPKDYEHSQAFDEVALALFDAFCELGIPITKCYNYPPTGFTPIIIGANLLTEVPDNSIIYNLEQISTGSPWITPKYIELLKKATVWDYSKYNIRALQEVGIEAKYLPIGYMPSLTHINHIEPDIDVLFIGSVNERRRAILNELHDKGAKVAIAFGVYGRERDDLIASSKIVINIHYYDAKVFEIVRCSYLMANEVCVVSETGSDVQLETQYESGIYFSPYNKLVDSCMALLQAPNARKTIAKKGFDIFSKQSQSEFLKVLL